MDLRRKTQPVSGATGPTTKTLDIPILPCNVDIAKFDVGDDCYGVLMLSNVLTSGMFTVDRGQVGQLWRSLRKLEQSMSAPGPKGLTVVENHLATPEDA